MGEGFLWGYLGTGLNVVLDHRDPCHRKQGFGHLKRQRPEASPWERREKYISSSSLPLTPPHQPFKPNLLPPFLQLLTLLRASNQDHSFEHDVDCYLNLKYQQRNQAQISQPNPETPLISPSKHQISKNNTALSRDVNPKFNTVLSGIQLLTNPTYLKSQPRFQQAIKPYGDSSQILKLLPVI